MSVHKIKRVLNSVNDKTGIVEFAGRHAHACVGMLTRRTA